MTCKIYGCEHKEIGFFIAERMFPDASNLDELGKYCVSHSKERRLTDIKNAKLDEQEEREKWHDDEEDEDEVNNEDGY